MKKIVLSSSHIHCSDVYMSFINFTMSQSTILTTSHHRTLKMPMAKTIAGVEDTVCKNIFQPLLKSTMWLGLLPYCAFSNETTMLNVDRM